MYSFARRLFHQMNTILRILQVARSLFWDSFIGGTRFGSSFCNVSEGVSNPPTRPIALFGTRSWNPCLPFEFVCDPQEFENVSCSHMLGFCLPKLAGFGGNSGAIILHGSTALGDVFFVFAESPITSQNPPLRLTDRPFQTESNVRISGNDARCARRVRSCGSRPSKERKGWVLLVVEFAVVGGGVCPRPPCENLMQPPRILEIPRKYCW